MKKYLPLAIFVACGGMALADVVPPAEISYQPPVNALYLGLNDKNEGPDTTIMVGPVYYPIKYVNTSANRRGDFTWIYENGKDKDNMAFDTDLNVTYYPDYSSETSFVNNIYPYPLLIGNTAAGAEVEFVYPGFYKAGGNSEFYTEDGIVNYGLSPVDPIREGVTTYIIDGVPIFGYNKESDNYWGYNSLGEEYNKNRPDVNFAHMITYGDLYYTPDTPVVIRGIRTNAYGKLKEGASLTANIYFLSADYEIPDKPKYSVVCAPQDISVISSEGEYDLLSLNFKFSQPVVISKKDCIYFVVAITGFRDPANVEFFSPVASEFSSPTALAMGWVGLNIRFNNQELPCSWSAAARQFEDEKRIGFYIMLDATLPWLHTDESVVEVAPFKTVDVAFDSYYDAKELSFSGLPSWLSASATGRYGDTVVSFTATEEVTSDQIVTVTVEGLGVSQDIMVSIKSAGVECITAPDDDAEAEFFTLDGRRVGGDPSPGIYIRKTGSKTEKIKI